MASAGFDDVAVIIQGRCSMCHAKEPFWPGVVWPPGGVRLETHAEIARNVHDIYIQSGLTHAMPPANVSFMLEEEREAIVDWYRNLQ